MVTPYVERLRILMIVDTFGWAYDRVAQGLKNYCNYAMVDVMAIDTGHQAIYRAAGSGRYDIVVTMDQQYVGDLRRRTHKKTLLVSTYNMAHATDGKIGDLVQADAVLVNNRGCWERQFEKFANTAYLPSAVDPGIFYPDVPWEQRANRVVWTASNKRPALKGYHEILLPLQTRLSARSIESDWWCVSTKSQWRTPAAMAKWYNQARYVICTSSSEGTPNYLLEAMACGCVPITTMAGNADDWLQDGKNGILIQERSVDAAEAAVLRAIDKGEELAKAALAEIRNKWLFPRRAAEMLAFFWDLKRRGRVVRRNWPDDFIDLSTSGPGSVDMTPCQGFSRRFHSRPIGTCQKSASQ